MGFCNYKVIKVDYPRFLTHMKEAYRLILINTLLMIPQLKRKCVNVMKSGHDIKMHAKHVHAKKIIDNIFEPVNEVECPFIYNSKNSL